MFSLILRPNAKGAHSDELETDQRHRLPQEGVTLRGALRGAKKASMQKNGCYKGEINKK